jgi:hypothetical protein
MLPNVFGPMTHAGMVEDAVRDVLTEWVNTYLAEVERQSGVTPGLTVRPKDWVRTTDPLQIKTTQLPTVAIVSPGWASPPEWDAGDDLGPTATVWYAVSVIVYAKGRGGGAALGRDEALNNARMLIAACREALTNKGELHDLISDVVVSDEELGTHVHATRERTLTDAEAVFVVRIDGAMTRTNGPAAPIPGDAFPDPGDYTTAETIEVSQSNLNEE